jgi:hypothetical protein
MTVVGELGGLGRLEREESMDEVLGGFANGGIGQENVLEALQEVTGGKCRVAQVLRTGRQTRSELRWRTASQSKKPRLWIRPLRDRWVRDQTMKSLTRALGIDDHSARVGAAPAGQCAGALISVGANGRPNLTRQALTRATSIPHVRGVWFGPRIEMLMYGWNALYVRQSGAIQEISGATN